jgi:formylglycine-generating enzyme required for sulfatase activity
VTGCCAPSREPPRPEAPVVEEVALRPSRDLASEGWDDLVLLDGGRTLVGSEEPGFPEEWPVREVVVASYRIARCAVTNAEFAEFVAATGHRTDAEDCGWSFVLGSFLPDDFPPTRGVAAAPWWRQVHGADWAHPEGPHSDVAARPDHPAVHVSRVDAEAYAAWRGVRLPTEAEWEHAARGGLAGQPFPWGSELEPGGEHRMNVWQGRFPDHDTGADGWRGTCPVDAFPGNAHGLHNMTGNVWEWCAGAWSAADPSAVSRGGSYLCHASYCRRYRVSARQSQSPDSSTGNVGFRIAANA